MILYHLAFCLAAHGACLGNGEGESQPPQPIGATQQARKKIEFPVTTTPRDAAISLYVAMIEGDEAAIESIWGGGSDNAFEVAKRDIEETAAAGRRLSAAIESRFGLIGSPLAVKLRQLPQFEIPGEDEPNDMHALLSTRPLERSGDTAQLKLSEDYIVEVERRENRWQVVKWPPVTHWSFALRLQKAVQEKTAERIEKGEVSNITDVYRELVENVAEALELSPMPTRE